MTESSAPWSTGNMGEAQWRDLLTGIIGEGGVVNDQTGTGLRVIASGANTQITVTPGEAVVQGALYSNDANLTLDVNSVGTPPSSALITRVDSVILRYDPTAKTVTAAVKAGAGALSNAVEPTLTRTPGGVWEVRLARITRKGNVPVTQAMVTSQRTWLGGVGYASADPTTGTWPVGSRLLTDDGEMFHSPTGWINLDKPPWTLLTLPSGFETYTSSPQYTKIRGWVHLRGGVQRANGNQLVAGDTTLVLSTLPAGYRPGPTARFSVGGSYQSDSMNGRISIFSSGSVEYATPHNGSVWTALDGIRFPAEN